MSNQFFSVPDEETPVELFGITPIISRPEDAIWHYQVIDMQSIILNLSFNIFERSLQTTIHYHEDQLVTIVQEGAVSLKPISPRFH